MPTMRAGTRHRVALLLRVLGAGVAIGAVLGGATGFGYRDAPLLGASLGALAGATTRVMLVGAILGTEIFLPSTRLGHALERAPFLVTFATKLLVYDDHRGEVFQYVGDEIVITWTVAEGRDGARPVACYFAIEQALARAAPEFEREFGAVPRLRAGLHGGRVITGEVGGSRHALTSL